MNMIDTTFCIVKKQELRDAASEGVLSNLKAFTRHKDLPIKVCPL